ncbi:MAG: hypothetical protein GF311_22840 [Candidatus Lokiarchaeota archaeon]|nr:hypothetical protein [Candidatus Lokiarchaeota archaeon]
MSYEESIEIYKEFLICDYLNSYILNNLSLYLKYEYENNQEKLDEYKSSISEILDYTSLEKKEINNLLVDFIDQKIKTQEVELRYEDVKKKIRKLRNRSHYQIEEAILDHQRNLREKLEKIPNTLEKAENLLLGLISVFQKYPFFFYDQVYDAIVLLKDKIPSSIIKTIKNHWEDELLYHIRSSRPSNIFWNSELYHEIDDMISRYRIKDQFKIEDFDLVFKEVELEIEEFLLEIRNESVGSFDLWLISRSLELSNKIRGISTILKRIKSQQYKEGFWGSWIVGIENPDIRLTALNSLILLKLSPYKELRKLGIIGAKYLRKNQNSNGSWTFQFYNKDREIKRRDDILTTIICLEVLRRSGLEKLEDVLEKGEQWIESQQNQIGLWSNSSFHPPFLSVLILEYFKNKNEFSNQLHIYQDDLTPENIIFLGMKKAVEISKNCVSEENKISPKVGALIIKNGEIVIETFRGETSPGDHAEYIALEKKGKDLNFKESILITTLEPCTKRSSDKIPCARRIVEAGIKEVWIGMHDPNPHITGKGVVYLTKNGVSVGFFPPSIIEEIKTINKEFWDSKIANYYENKTDNHFDIMAVKKD